MAKPKPVDTALVGRNVHLLVGEGEAPMQAGMEITMRVVRQAPPDGPRRMEGVLGEPEPPIPPALRDRQVFALPRYEGDSIEDVLRGTHLTVNILLYERDERLICMGTGTVRLL